MTSSKPKKVPTLSRRRFLTDICCSAAGTALLGMGIATWSNHSNSYPVGALRPPGALSEKEFQALCTRCGICVRDCPFDILKLADFAAEVALGTPYFIARDGGCEMCVDIPCIPNCPTGALDHELKEINDARMGLAVVIDQESCIAFQGLRCEVCFNICPIRGSAITIEISHNRRSGKHARFIPVVHSDSCTGCGKCEEACITDIAAIKVLPTKLAKGALGEHYRLGWQEKERAGRSLVTPDIEHQYNLPEGLDYDQRGQGLKAREKDNGSDDRASPSASQQSLNQLIKQLEEAK